MTSLVLFEDAKHNQFYPLAFWRPVFSLRSGYDRLIDRAARMMRQPIDGVWTRDWIASVAETREGVPANGKIAADTVLINARWLMPEAPGFNAGPHVGVIGDEPAYIACDNGLAQKIMPGLLLDEDSSYELLEGLPTSEAPGTMLQYPWDLIRGLKEQLEADCAALESNEPASSTTAAPCITAPERVFIDPRATVHPTAVLDASHGAITIGPEVIVEPYAVIEGPCFIGHRCRIRPHAHLHGANAIGPLCKLGGEIDGCIIHSCTNKQHYGFLGHSVIGSWVNLGAGTSNSDLKNTYGSVRVPMKGTEIDTRMMFFGAVIADHVKTAINSTIPTGAVIGTAAVLAASRVLSKSVPPFAWLTDAGEQAGDAQQLLAVARKVMSRREENLSPEEEELFLYIAQQFGGLAPS